MDAEITRTAQRQHISIITTLQLHAALSAKQLGDFNETKFWDAVMETDDCCDLPATGDPSP